MKPRRVETHAFLQGLDSECAGDGYLANRHERLYTLEILAIDAAGRRVALALPRARSKWVEVEQEWQLRFRDHEGVYQADVTGLAPEEDRIWVSLPDRLTFLARRRSIRLPTGSRSPTEVTFHAGDHDFRGNLVDLSMDGLGVQMPDHSAEGCPLSVDDPISDVRFVLRDRPITIRAGKVAHLGSTDRHCRLGIELVDPDVDVIETLRAVIDQWHHSQRASVSPA